MERRYTKYTYFSESVEFSGASLFHILSLHHPLLVASSWQGGGRASPHQDPRGEGTLPWQLQHIMRLLNTHKLFMSL